MQKYMFFLCKNISFLCKNRSFLLSIKSLYKKNQKGKINIKRFKIKKLLLSMRK